MYVYYVLNFISLYKFICILIIISLIYFLFVNKIWIMYIQFNNYQSKNSRSKKSNKTSNYNLLNPICPLPLLLDYPSSPMNLSESIDFFFEWTIRGKLVEKLVVNGVG